MARSMTGFGQATVTITNFTCTSRVKSVNNRYMTISTRIDPPDEELEVRVRRLMQECASRGSIDVNIRTERKGEACGYVFNEALLRALRPALVEAGALVTLDGLVRIGILQIGDGTQVHSEEDVEAILGCLRSAVADWNLSRHSEGATLAREMVGMLGELELIREDITRMDQGRPETLQTRLRARLEQLLSGQSLREERLIEEAAVLAQRSDITEELDRLGSHFRALGSVFTESDEQPVGKRIEFLVQEMQREFNTIGSKAQEARLSGRVVDAKVLLEKLKQQAANIE